jgi:hypothetical protein
MHYYILFSHKKEKRRINEEIGGERERKLEKVGERMKKEEKGREKRRKGRETRS